MERRNSFAIGILALLAGILLFFQTPIMETARFKAWDLLTSASAFVFSIEDAQQEESLPEELSRLQAENTRLKAEGADYRRLRRQLGTPEIADVRLLAAAVVGRPIETYQSIIIISRGTADGISIGDPAVVFGNVLVGFISATHEHSAELTSLYHPSVSVPAEAVNNDEEAPAARGLLTSSFYSALRLTTVPKDTTLSVDQSVVTTADGSKVPYGLLVGQIESVKNEEFDPYQEARIKVPYDLDTIDVVTILTQP
ncbi:MAG: rod shape-determining protein MreC [Candidatus Andersenbacteria bacterium]|nr:rod shape-determining protein MreC [Candidatus Andersenbacteria bacterium]MBI3250341.1 rod shape-determining protein MreC [Candidatus Andersenbacteria bacterium]